MEQHLITLLVKIGVVTSIASFGVRIEGVKRMLLREERTLTQRLWLALWFAAIFTPGVIIRLMTHGTYSALDLAMEGHVPNENGQLLPGAYMQVHLSTGGNRQSLLVPANTVLFRSDGTTIGVVGSDNKVELKKIEIGKDLGTHLEIAQGLSPDDRLIINPSDSLASGQIVRIRPSQKEQKPAIAAKHA